MIKKLALNKIVILCMYIVLLSLFYIIPINKEVKSNTNEVNDNLNKGVIYLLDKDNYVSMVNIYYDELSIIDEIKYRINVLINGINNDSFYPLIPKNTILNSVKIDNSSVYLDFNNNILNVSKYLTESMIESIIYSLCEINGINDIYISVDNNLLEDINGYKLTYPLNKNYGINKKYDIDNLNNINKTTVVFYKNDNNNEYYIPITYVNNNSSNKIDIILEELKSSVNSQDNLDGIIDENIILSSYDINDNTFTLVFNEYETNSILNNVLYYSIINNYEVKNVVIK